MKGAKPCGEWDSCGDTGLWDCRAGRALRSHSVQSHLPADLWQLRQRGKALAQSLTARPWGRWDKLFSELGGELYLGRAQSAWAGLGGPFPVGRGGMQRDTDNSERGTVVMTGGVRARGGPLSQAWGAEVQEGFLGEAMSKLRPDGLMGVRRMGREKAKAGTPRPREQHGEGFGRTQRTRAAQPVQRQSGGRGGWGRVATGLLAGWERAAEIL